MSQFIAIRVIRYVTVLFVFGIAIAMFLYPGGTIHDSAQEGYSFTHNFLSDLGAYKSHSGEANFLSSFVFGISLLLFVLSGLAFFAVPNLFIENKLTYKLAIIGSMFFCIGSIFFAGVGLTPHDLFFEAHIFFALNSFRFLIPGALFYLVVFARSNVHKGYSFLLSFFLISVCAYVFYEMISGSPSDSLENMVTHAIAQKMIVLVCIFSMFCLTFAFSSILAKKQGLPKRKQCDQLKEERLFPE